MESGHSLEWSERSVSPPPFPGRSPRTNGTQQAPISVLLIMWLRGWEARMLKFVTPFIVVGALLNPSKAQDAAKMKQALTNFEADLSICLAYFSIIRECSSRNGNFLRLAQFATDRLTSIAAKTADALGIPPADA